MAQVGRKARRAVAVVGCAVLSWLAVVGACFAQELRYPLAVAAAGDDAVYLADRDLPGIWKVAGGRRSVFFQGERKLRTPLNAVRCLAVDGEGRLLAGDSATREVYRFDAEGKPQPLTGGAVGIPMSLAVNRAGEIFVADLESHEIRVIPKAGGPPRKAADLVAPRGVTFDSQDRLWIVSGGDSPLWRLAGEGPPEPVVKGRPFEFPHQAAIDDAGAAYVTDGYAKAIWKVEPSGEVKKLAAGPPLVNPVGIARRGAEFLIVDPRARSLWSMTSDGKLTAIPLEP